MTLPNPTNTIMAQAITAAVDGILAKSQHELRGLLRDFCDTTARIQVHALEDTHDQVGDFNGMPIYDVYDDELSTTLVYDFCGEPHHKSDVTTKEGDTSSQITERPTFTSNLGRYDVPIKDFAEEPLFDVSDDQIQGFNHDFEVQVLVDDAYLGVTKQHMNSGLGDKDFHRQSHHEPPDRGRDKGHAYVDLVAIHKGLTSVNLDDEFCCDAMSGPLEWLVSKKSRGTENGFHGGINTSQPTSTKDIHLATTEHLGVMSMVAHLRLCERPWKYCSGTFYDSLGDIYVAFVRTHDPLSPREETMDPVVRNKEIINLSSPVCLDMLVLFQTVAKLSGEVSFLDVMIVIYPTSSTWLVYFAKGSLQKFVILGVDVSYCFHQPVCALMRLYDLFVGKRKENLQLEWMFLMGSVVFYVGNLMTFGEDEHVKVQILTCLVSFTKFLCVRFGSRWKHVDLNGRPEAFDMIQYVWVFGAYKTVTFIELPRSTALWTLFFPSQWLQMELQWGISNGKVEVLHNPQTGLGCIFLATLCWSNIACESSNLGEYSNSAFQHVCEAATCFLTLSVLPSASTKVSMIVWVITRSVVSYESLELAGEENCSCPYVRHMSAMGYFWIIVIADKVFHRGYAINNGELQLVKDKKSVLVAYRCGSRTIFVIIEGKLFSLVRPMWSSLALRSAYPTVHLLPSISSLHELCHGVVTKEFDLVCLEFTAAGSAHMVVVESDFPGDSVQVLEFIGFFSHVHDQLFGLLGVSYAKYKAAAGWHRPDLQFNVGAYILGFRIYLVIRSGKMNKPNRDFKYSKRRASTRTQTRSIRDVSAART
ncbi:hypothetical protein F2Q70_00007545 [Brassica cretica]|uniref:Uncharacterized protein n=1 Tax=Brassica cretica TaxID=69181 RepID=A0A8S9JCJ9_BRACR|nr:hypothetical protein F2Q68_00000594 [Brassica cretica]KAF2609701.1 hypothetical protein F2Q70_00007545 [Brassica cretica]